MHVLRQRALEKRAWGFTLVELMVAIAVAAILLVIAVPSFTTAINSNRLTSTANALIGSLNAARMEAVQRNAPVQFCSNSATSNTSDTLGTACGTNAGAVFALTSPGATTTTQLQVPPSELGISSIQIHGTMAAVRFNGQGQGLTPGTSTPVDGTVVMDVCSTSLSTNNHIQVNMAAGSVITTTTSTGACP
ncbi:MAG TPA: GspH/FimT family pseudopilin [Candidatus Saccharimonadales bacterium]|nr:GspH/FimT family pseudopilin [Candidatus Saccharimonadales bacterium]